MTFTEKKIFLSISSQPEGGELPTGGEKDSRPGEIFLAVFFFEMRSYFEVFLSLRIIVRIYLF